MKQRYKHEIGQERRGVVVAVGFDINKVKSEKMEVGGTLDLY